MAGIADILRRLAAPVADDVARAAAEFGDDAVRSIMKTTPAMRKRLAALAERQMGVAAKRSKNYAEDLDFSDSRGLEESGRGLNSLFKDLVGDSGRLFGADPFVVGTSSRIHGMVPLKDYSDVRNKIADIAIRSKRNADVPVDVEKAISYLDLEKKIAARNADRFVNSDMSKAFDVASNNYNDAVMSVATKGRLPGRVTEAKSRTEDLNKILSNFSEDVLYDTGPGNIEPAVNQARLAALLRMIGDAQ
jgi:hypothetical protein